MERRVRRSNGYADDSMQMMHAEPFVGPPATVAQLGVMTQ